MTSNLLIIVALINFIMMGIVCLQWYLGIKKVPFLRDYTPESNITPLPSLSIIVAACNEEDTIEKAINTMANLDYDQFELIVINDRSTDNTGRILENLKKQYPEVLKVFHVDKLPEGWLGKNHALYIGANNSNGEWLLFTDADVLFSPETMRYAINFALKNNIDHLPLFPEVIGGTLPFRVYFTFWSISVAWLIFAQKHIGVGAFNLIKRNAYNDIGTHRAIALRPDDDIKLGKLVVKHGFKQQFILGNGLVNIKWYENLGEIMKGFEKNAFSTINYNLPLMIIAIMFSVVYSLYPFIGVWLGDWRPRLINLISIMIILLTYTYNAKFFGNKFWYAFFHPITALIYNYSILRATLKTIFNNGIEWRGTKYSLDELKKNQL